MSGKALLYTLEPQGRACVQIRLSDPFLRMQDEYRVIWGVSRKKKLFVKYKSISSGPISSADLIVVQRFFPQPRTAQVMGRLTWADAPVIFDLDDNLINLPKNHVDYPALESSIPYMREFMSVADAVTVSTPELAKVAKALNPSVHILPNLLNEQLWNGAGTCSKDGKVVVLFGGTPTHTKDAEMLDSVIYELCMRYPEKIKLTLMGCSTERLASLPGVRFLEFKTSYEDYASALQAEPVDIAVVPLEDTSFNACKSNIKWLEYSSCGIPGVYAATPPYRDITQGRTGLLARSASDWLEAIDVLVRDEELRRSIAEEARYEVNMKFTLGNQLNQYISLYEHLINEKKQLYDNRKSGWFRRFFLGG